MVGSEYSTEDCKPPKIIIRVIIRNKKYRNIKIRS